MRLNNRGWGFGMFLIFILILSIVIIFIWYSSVKLNNSFKELMKNNNYYYKMESNLSNSAGLFLNDNPINECNSIGCTINYEILRNNNYIDKLLDEKNKSECNGYVKVINDVYTPYISCSNYTTGGYK